jgi:hypothetical protein
MRESKVAFLYQKYRVLQARVEVHMTNKSTNTFMFVLANEGIDPVVPVGPSIKYF